MFYDQFKKLCDERGEKPTPVAKKLGCSSSNVALWKKGSVPRTPVLSKIADYFGVTTQYLLFGDETKKSPAVSGEGLDATTRQLFDFVDGASDTELLKVLDYIEFIKSQRNTKK